MLISSYLIQVKHSQWCVGITKEFALDAMGSQEDDCNAIYISQERLSQIMGQG